MRVVHKLSCNQKSKLNTIEYELEVPRFVSGITRLLEEIEGEHYLCACEDFLVVYGPLIYPVHILNDFLR